MRAVPTTKAAGYAPIAGDQAYLDAVSRDVFGDDPEVLAQVTAVATPGGTGALHHAMRNFLEEGQSLFTTSFFWGPYRIIAQHSGRGIETFRMFDEAGDFDLAAFEAGLEAQLERQGRALVVLNFPCHNPTGYSLHEDQWRSVAAILERAGERHPVALLVDLAYSRYGAPGTERWVEWVRGLSRTCTLMVAWTASKSFAQYGSRVGALIVRSRDGEDPSDIRNALAYSCRATWSNCNHLGILAITSILEDQELASRVDAERDRLTRLLGERVELFNRVGHEEGLHYPRYEGGFFVTVFTPDPQRVAELAREDGVFVVPVQGAVRVALCSTPASLVPRLVRTLAAALRKADEGS